MFIHAYRGTKEHVLNKLRCHFLRKYDFKIRQIIKSHFYMPFLQ